MYQNNLRCVVFLIICLPLLGCSATDRNDVVILGDICLRIPRENRVDDSILNLLPEAGGHDPAQMIRIKFNISLPVNMPSSKIRNEDFTAVIGRDLGQVSLDRRMREGLKDGWYGSGAYSKDRLGRRITFDNTLDLFRVYMEKIPHSWVFMTKNPQDNVVFNTSYVVARCSDGAVKNTFNCIRTVLRDGFYVQYWVRGSRVKFYKKIDDYIFRNLELWKYSSCI